MMNRDDCLKLGIGHSDRVRITGERSVVCAVVVSDSVVPKGSVAMPVNVQAKCGAADGDRVDVVYSPMPESIRSIRKKINGGKLSGEEIAAIVSDIMDGGLSETEVIAFVSSFNVNNSDMQEISELTYAMAATGKTVDLGNGPLYDFHSLGGVSGNKITPIVVSIVASEGLVIPKLSSRAVSSACGTADFVDTFCDVEMDSDCLTEAVAKAGGVFACGNDDYAPVGGLIILAERPMGIDPRPTMMASIMSKKVALGTTHLVLDIPLGKGSKIASLEEARAYARDFIDLGAMIGIRTECLVTHADEPLGLTVGPVLEAKECISILENGGGDPAVVDKACSMAGAILEMAGRRNGKGLALDVLRSGRAHRKFLEIVEVQNGDPGLRSSDLVPGSFHKDVHAKHTGYVQYIDNRSIVAIAKATGAPTDEGAGVEFMHKTGDHVLEGDVLFRIYAETASKLERAVDSARSRRPMSVGPLTMDRYSADAVIERILPE